MEAGIAVSRITPPLGVMMGGYGHRDHGAEAVADDLMLRVLALQHAGRRSALLTADLLWLRREAADAARLAVAARCGVDPALVLLSCSHTHSGPQTASDCPGIGTPDPAYMRRLLGQVASTAVDAFARLRPATLAVADRGRGGLGINRRVTAAGRTQMLPNPQGPRDDEVLVVALRDASGAPLASLFQYACHPTCLGGYDLSADWPGAAARSVEAETGAPCLFVQGCCGDVRPNVTTREGRFRQATVPETHAAGAAIGAEVLRRLGGHLTAVAPRLGGAVRELGLEFAAVPDAVELAGIEDSGAPRQAALARFLLARPERLGPAAPFRIHRFDLGPELAILGMEGEICVGYGFAAKACAGSRLVMPAGYVDGCTAYIPTAEMFPEGGYEVAESFPYFGMPGPFAPTIDGQIRSAIESMLRAG